MDGADLSSAARVIDQLAAWVADYNSFTPHSSLGMRSPLEYRQAMAAQPAERSV